MSRRDAEAVAALSGQLGYPSSPEDIERRFRALEGASDSHAIVAEDDDGRIVGWLHVCGTRHLESDTVAEVVGLVVAQDRRSRGVGSALMAAAELWARAHGFGDMTVRSNVIRIDAHEFYKRLGFDIVKSQYKFHKKLPQEVKT